MEEPNSSITLISITLLQLHHIWLLVLDRGGVDIVRLHERPFLAEEGKVAHRVAFRELGPEVHGVPEVPDALEFARVVQ